MDEYEGMEVDEDDDAKGPGPQRCEYFLPQFTRQTCSITQP